jgi:hypothetical protein
MLFQSSPPRLCQPRCLGVAALQANCGSCWVRPPSSVRCSTGLVTVTSARLDHQSSPHLITNHHPWLEHTSTPSVQPAGAGSLLPSPTRSCSSCSHRSCNCSSTNAQAHMHISRPRQAPSPAPSWAEGGGCPLTLAWTAGGSLQPPLSPGLVPGACARSTHCRLDDPD